MKILKQLELAYDKEYPVKIYWMDIVNWTGWIKKLDDKEPPVECLTLGYVIGIKDYKKTKVIITSSTVSHFEDKTPSEYIAHLTIPLSVIKKVIKI